jgi:hypothetical protein
LQDFADRIFDHKLSVPGMMVEQAPAHQRQFGAADRVSCKLDAGGAGVDR